MPWKTKFYRYYDSMKDMPYLAKAFGQTLRRYRAQAQMTQGELALKINSVSSYIRFLEYGQKMPTLNTFHQICQALDIDPHEFMYDYLQAMNRLCDTSKPAMLTDEGE